jgi:ferredoxin
MLVKAFFTNPKEKLGRYFTQPQASPAEKIAIFGVKNCDLFSLKIQDFVFLEGSVKDPFYAKNRSNTFLITGDCLDFKEVCFCLALGINPFPQEGFDLNFSPLNAGFLVDLGSLAGADCVEKMANLFIPATASQLAAREQKRNNLSRRLQEHLALHNIPEKEILPDIVRNGQAPQFWQEAVLNCVECGGCNLICDTCHCFLLSDERFGNVHEKVRSWDACLYANFARVAGGANPLRYRYQRLRNRYEKKFDFFPENLGLSACCGCGRCIEVCPAKIDIREVLKNLKAQFIQKQG